jgi:phage internal scaffolding protein
MGKKISYFKPTKTQQHEANNMNINEIMSRYNKTKMAPVTYCTPQYGDFSKVNDYHTSLNKVINIQNEFMELPANIKKRFKNNPANLINFMNDNENYHEAIELGLIEKPENYYPPVKEDKASVEERIDKIEKEAKDWIEKRDSSGSEE